MKFAADRPLWLRVTLFSLAYFASAELGTYLTFQPHQFVSIWLPAGVFLAVLLSNPTKLWPWFVAAVFPASIAFNSFEGKSWQVGCLFTVANCMEALAGAWLVRRFIAESPRLKTLRELAGLMLLGGALAAILGATVAALVIRVLGSTESYWSNAFLWWSSVNLGIFLLAPALLVWRPTGSGTAPLSSSKLLEAAVLFIGLVLSTSWGFNYYWDQALSMEYLPLPFLAWASFRFGLRGVTLANLVVCILAAWLSTRSIGDLSNSTLSPYVAIGGLQLLLAIIVFVGLIPAVMMDTLKASETKYRLITESVQDVVWTLDTQSLRFLYVSPSVYRLRGYTPEEIIAESMDAALTPDAANLLRGKIQRQAADFLSGALSPSHFYVTEVEQPRKDGTTVWTEVVTNYRFNEETGRVELHGVSRDISERKRTEEALRQSQKMEALGQLAGGIAHDFNNILAATMLNLSLLKEDPRLLGDLRTSLDGLEADTRRAAELTRQLLLFGRKKVMEAKPVELNQSIAGMLKMLRRIIGENIRIAVEQGAPKIWIHADPGMIDQVVMNLCVNARDAMPHGGGLRLSTGLTHLEEGAPLPHPEARPGDFVCLGVQDSGCGMSEEVLQHAFEPFFTTKGVGKGTGLGLSTVHGIVSQHRGWVQVQSTPGRGTHFQVFLPLAQEPEKSELRASPTSFLGGSETLLVVEDEAVVRHAISTRLRKLGYQVVEASNGREALEHWAKQAAEIHLLFTDMVMPEGMTGIELAQALRAQNPGLRVIISSGYSAEIMNASDPSLKGCGFLAKPFSVEALAEMVRKTLDGRV